MRRSSSRRTGTFESEWIAGLDGALCVRGPGVRRLYGGCWWVREVTSAKQTARCALVKRSSQSHSSMSPWPGHGDNVRDDAALDRQNSVSLCRSTQYVTVTYLARGSRTQSCCPPISAAGACTDSWPAFAAVDAASAHRRNRRSRRTPRGYPGTDSKRRMRRDLGGRAALTKHRYTESNDFKPQKARYWPLSSRCLGTTCPAQLGVHGFVCQWPTSYVRISTVLRPRSPTTSTSAAVLITYRKDGTAVASSVFFLFRDNTFEVRAVPLRTAVDVNCGIDGRDHLEDIGSAGRSLELPTHGPTSAPRTS